MEERAPGKGLMPIFHGWRAAELALSGIIRKSVGVNQGGASRMNPAGEASYYLIWIGIAFLLGMILLLTRLILNTEIRADRKKAEDATSTPDGSATMNFFAGLHGEIPRVAQTQREMLEGLKKPPHLSSLNDHLRDDLIWMADRSMASSGLRYELRVGRGGPLVAVIEWATPDPLYALMLIGDQRWVFERRGEYEEMRISIRLLENEVWVKKGSLSVYTGVLEFDDADEIKWITPVFNAINRFVDGASHTLATFDVSEQKGFADNTTWVTLRAELPYDLRAPIVGLGFFVLTPEP